VVYNARAAMAARRTKTKKGRLILNTPVTGPY